MMNRREELNVEMMEQVNGGATKFYHEGCGGNLWNAQNPFYKVKCSKCGDKHYLTGAFEKVIYTSDNGKTFWWYCGDDNFDDEMPYDGDTSSYH